MNLSGFQSALARKTGIAVDPVGSTDWINEAIQAVSEERDWPWLDASDTFTTTPQQAQYPLPSDWKTTRSVLVNDVQASRSSTVDINQGTPMYGGWVFTIENSNLVLYPTPSSAVTVRHMYVRQEPHLSSASDIPLIPSQFHQAVVAYAAARVCERMGDSRAKLFDKEYERWLNRMFDAMSRSREPRTIRVRPGSVF